jgi:hypothetical protein
MRFLFARTATDVRCWHATFLLGQDRDDLFFGKSALPHVRLQVTDSPFKRGTTRGSDQPVSLHRELPPPQTHQRANIRWEPVSEGLGLIAKLLMIEFRPSRGRKNSRKDEIGKWASVFRASPYCMGLASRANGSLFWRANTSVRRLLGLLARLGSCRCEC